MSDFKSDSTSGSTCPSGPVREWAASGAMALTGLTDGPPTVAPGTPAVSARRSIERLAAAVHERVGTEPALPDVQLLGERAALQAFRRQGPWSCGGSFRTMETADGWWGLSLPRVEDVLMVPALVERANATAWQDVAAWAAVTSTADAVARGRLIGLACSAPGEPVPARSGVEVLRRGGPRPGGRSHRPLVVDLSALWAGPLCAHLLRSTGARVVKVESPQRPDGTRRRPAFFDLLNGGAEMVAVDLHDPKGVTLLRRLLTDADVVIESSRPKALRNIGIAAEHYVDDGAVWVSVTARGRSSDTIGFGDDVAVGAGLAVPSRWGPLPCGDALADPLTGLAAAAAAAEALLYDDGVLLDVSMHHVCAAAAGDVPDHSVEERDGAWWVSSDEGDFEVLEPRARAATAAARPLGADTQRILVRR